MNRVYRTLFPLTSENKERLDKLSASFDLSVVGNKILFKGNESEHSRIRELLSGGVTA